MLVLLRDLLRARDPRGYVLAFTLAYLSLFSFYFAWQGDLEFLWYVFLIIAAMMLVAATIRITRFPVWILSGFSMLGLMHMAGGSILVGGDVLYTYRFVHLFTGVQSFDFTLIKYDQVVHLFGMGVVAAALRYLLLHRAPHLSRLGRVCLIFFAAMGVGALNEIVEFIATIALPHTWVGDYYNTALDLTANAAGAVLSIGILEWRDRLKKTV